MFGQSVQMCRTGSTEKRCCRLGLFGNGEHGQHGEQERGRATAYGTPLRSYRSPVGERLPCEQRQKSTGAPLQGCPGNQDTTMFGLSDLPLARLVT